LSGANAGAADEFGALADRARTDTAIIKMTTGKDGGAPGEAAARKEGA
jgi:hypothetical protein